MFVQRDDSGGGDGGVGVGGSGNDDTRWRRWRRRYLIWRARFIFDAIHLSVAVLNVCGSEDADARTRAHMKTTFIVGAEKWQKTPALNENILVYLFRWCRRCCCYCCLYSREARMEQTLKHPFVSTAMLSVHSEQTAEKLLQFAKEYCHTVVRTTTIRINFVFGSTFPFPSCYR